MTEYPRMKYGYDQREWVRVADEKLPGLIRRASKQQQLAAHAHAYIEQCLELGRPVFRSFFELRQDAYAESIMLLNCVLYYQGMRRANLPE